MNSKGNILGMQTSFAQSLSPQEESTVYINDLMFIYTVNRSIQMEAISFFEWVLRGERS